MKKIFVVSLLFVVVGCVTDNQDNYDFKKWTYSETLPEPLELTAELSKQSFGYRLNLYIENKTDSTIELWQWGGNAYEFIILDENSEIMWKEHLGARSLGISNFYIEPDKELVRSYNWVPLSNTGQILDSDKTYSLHGIGYLILDINDDNNSEPDLYMTDPVKFILK